MSDEARIPLAVSLDIEEFSGTTIQNIPSYVKNGIISMYHDGNSFVTQRPSINVFINTTGSASSVTDRRGRGIYYWNNSTDPALHFINNDTIYKNSLGGNLATTISSGAGKCYFAEVGSLLMLSDPDNDECWTVGVSGTVTDITTYTSASGFPSTLAHGIATLDGYAFVLDEDGVTYQSGSEDLTVWNPLDTLEASRQYDGGIHIDTHKDHVVVFGSRSIEFFGNAGNPTGSTLKVRKDIFYNVGCISGETVWKYGNALIFIGVDRTGNLGIYKLEEFVLSKLSKETLDSFLTYNRFKNGLKMYTSGAGGQGHPYYIVTFYTEESNDRTATLTIVFDVSTGAMYIWDITALSLSTFPLIDWTIRGGDTTRAGEGILANGDCITFNDNLIPIDTIAGDNYFKSGYIAAGYFTSYSSAGTNIDFLVRTGHFDGGTSDYKFHRSLEVVGDYTQSSQTATIKWSDNTHDAFNSGRTLELDKPRKLWRLGRFVRRNFELSYSGSDQVRWQELDLRMTKEDL